MRPNRPWVVLATAVVGVLLALSAATPAQADVCQSLDTGPIPNPLQVGCQVVKKGAEVVSHPGKAVTDVVTAPVKAAGDAVMQGVTDWVGKGAGWLVAQAGKLIDATTTPRIESPWFLRQYGTMAALAAVFALPLLLLSVLQGVLRRDSGVIVRAAFVQLPLAFLLAAMAVTVVQLCLQLTDAMSAQVAASVGNDARSFFADVAKALGAIVAATGSPVPLFAVFLGAVVAAVGAFFVWVELLLRSAAIYVAVLFLPLAFVAMIWPQTQRWCRRLVELLFAIVFSKFVIVAIMALAAAGLGQSRAADAFQGVLAGAALMLLAAFSPMALLKLLPFAEAAVSAASHRGGAGSSTLAPVASPAAVMRRVVDSNWGGAAGGGGLRAAPAFAGPAGAAAGAGAAGAGAAGRSAGNRAQDIGGAGTRANGGGGGGGTSAQADQRPGSAPNGASSGRAHTGTATSRSDAGGQPGQSERGTTQQPRPEGGERPMAPRPRPPRPSQDKPGGTDGRG